MVLCKLCSVRQSTLFGFVSWMHFQKIHTKLSHICVSEHQSEDKSKFPVRHLETVAQLPGTSQRYRKEVLSGGTLLSFLFASLSLSFSAFRHSLLYRHLKLFFLLVLFFINGSSLPHLFILSEVGPMPCPSDCIVRVALS